MILEHRQVAKLKSTYADALPGLVDADGRLHTTYSQAVAATGRLSSTDPNLQNIPIRTALGRRIRRVFVAPPGKLLLAADYSQVELRILAHVSGDAGLKAAFAAGEDIHPIDRGPGARHPAEEVTAEQRSIAKMVNFGVAYGMSDFGLAERLHIDRETARQFITDYFAAYEGIRRYTIEIRILARDQGYVTTLLGRRRYLPELTARNAALRAAGERMAINMPIQGTAADGIKIAMVRLDAAMRERGLRFAHAPPGPRRAGLRDRCRRAGRARRPGGRDDGGALPLDVPLTVDLKVGTDWDRMDRLVPAEGGGYRVIEVDHAEEAVEEAVVARRGRCLSCPRSRPSPDGSRPACPGPRSSAPRSSGPGRSPTPSRPSGSRWRSPAASSAASAAGRSPSSCTSTMAGC